MGVEAMARIPYPNLDNLDPEVGAFMKRIDPMINVFHMMAHAETAVRPFMRLGNALLFKGELDDVLREIVILRVGHVTGSTYEVHQHRIVGRNCGMTEEQIDGVADGSKAVVFDERQKLAIRMVDEVIADVRMSDETFNEAVEIFNSREITEILIVIGFYNMIAGVLENLQVEIEAPGLVDNPLKRAKPG
ncbi:MAG: carboxymuconolactone decarboxylase family protein [Alphaproteobacteria bacterium]|jgi:4-carboxymuconolactone decarboxylase